MDCMEMEPDEGIISKDWPSTKMIRSEEYDLNKGHQRSLTIRSITEWKCKPCQEKGDNTFLCGYSIVYSMCSTSVCTCARHVR